jgi:hypothetical protein
MHRLMCAAVARMSVVHAAEKHRGDSNSVPQHPRAFMTTQQISSCVVRVCIIHCMYRSLEPPVRPCNSTHTGWPDFGIELQSKAIEPPSSSGNIRRAYLSRKSRLYMLANNVFRCGPGKNGVGAYRCRAGHSSTNLEATEPCLSVIFVRCRLMIRISIPRAAKSEGEARSMITIWLRLSFAREASAERSVLRIRSDGESGSKLRRRIIGVEIVKHT